MYLWILAAACGLAAGLSPAPIARNAMAAALAHDSVSCQMCHFADDSGRTAGLTRQSACRSCHDAAAEGLAVELGFHAGRGRDCSQCHSFHEPEQLRIPGGRMSRASLAKAGVDHCRSCHGSGGHLAELSPAHWTAANLYHNDTVRLEGLTPSEGCLLCHGNAGDPAWRQAVPEAALTFDRHSTHPLGVPNRASRSANAYLIRNEKDAGLPLFGGRIECQTCHLVPSRRGDLLRTSGDEEALCGRCHQRNAPTLPAAAASLGASGLDGF